MTATGTHSWATDLVSVIVPVHNGRRYLAESLNSVLQSTYSKCELIVVDDGSTDGSGDLAAALCPQAVIVRQPRCGLAGARNTGLQQARGEYIQFLDSDDLLAPNKIARQVAVLQAEPTAALAVSTWRVFGDSHTPVTAGQPRLAHRMWPGVLAGTPFPVHTALLRRSRLPQDQRFDTRLPCAEDWDYWVRLFRQGQHHIYTPQTEVYYRRHDQQMTDASRIPSLCATVSQLARRYAQFCRQESVCNWQPPLARAVLRWAHQAFVAGQRGPARNLFSQAQQLLHEAVWPAAPDTLDPTELGLTLGTGLRLSVELDGTPQLWRDWWSWYQRHLFDTITPANRLDLLFELHAQWLHVGLADEAQSLITLMPKCNPASDERRQAAANHNHRYHHLVVRLDDLERRVQQYLRLAVYGAGLHTRWLLSLSPAIRQRVHCLVDDHPALHGRALLDRPIQSPETLEHEQIDAVLISSDRHEYTLVLACENYNLRRLPVLTIYTK